MLYEIAGSKGKERILRVFFIAPRRDFSLTELSQQASVSKAQTKEILDVLVKKDIVSARGKRYRLNADNYVVEQLRKILDERAVLAEMIKRVEKTFSKTKISAVLIGSMTRHAEKPTSDIDCLIVCENKALPQIRKVASELGDELSETFSRYVELLVIEKREFNRLKRARDPFYVNVLSDYELIKDDLGAFR